MNALMYKIVSIFKATYSTHINNIVANI